MAPLGFFRSSTNADRPPPSPTPRSPGFRTTVSHSPPPTATRNQTATATHPQVNYSNNVAVTSSSSSASTSRLRRLKSGSFSFGRYDAPLSPLTPTSTFHDGLGDVNELDELGRMMTRSGRRRDADADADADPTGALDRSRTSSLRVMRPRGASESAGDRGRPPRLWFSRNKATNNTSALSDDEGDSGAPMTTSSTTGEMVISAPMPPLDGRPMKSANALEDLIELQRNVVASGSSNRSVTTSGSVSSGSISKVAGAGGGGMASFDDSIFRPVTPPSIPRISSPSTSTSSGQEFLTPLSPPRRHVGRTRKSPRIAPLVFKDTSTASSVPSPTSSDVTTHSPSSIVLGTVQTSSRLRDASPASHDVTARTELPSPTTAASARLQSPTTRQVPPSPSKSSIKGWQVRSVSNASSSSSSPGLEQAFVQTSRSGRLPPRSLSDAASMRSSPEPASTENEEETEELRSFDDADDSAVDEIWSNKTMSQRQTIGALGALHAAPQIPGYSVQVVCSEETGRDGDADSGEEAIRWEVVIRKTKSSPANVATLPASTSPVALRAGHAAAVAPSTASSINLSLSLDRPTGKLVFISLPVDPQHTSTPRPRSNSRGGLAAAKTEMPESPSSISARFQSTVKASLPSTHPRSPLPGTNNSTLPSPLSPTPPLSPSPKINRFPSQRRKAPPISTLPPPSPSSSFGVSRFPDSPLLVTPRSPPASPRDVFMQRRKASLQDGVLFTPDL